MQSSCTYHTPVLIPITRAGRAERVTEVPVRAMLKGATLETAETQVVLGSDSSKLINVPQVLIT